MIFIEREKETFSWDVYIFHFHPPTPARGGYHFEILGEKYVERKKKRKGKRGGKGEKREKINKGKNYDKICYIRGENPLNSPNLYGTYLGEKI